MECLYLNTHIHTQNVNWMNGQKKLLIHLPSCNDIDMEFTKYKHWQVILERAKCFLEPMPSHRSYIRSDMRLKSPSLWFPCLPLLLTTALFSEVLSGPGPGAGQGLNPGTQVFALGPSSTAEGDAGKVWAISTECWLLPGTCHSECEQCATTTTSTASSNSWELVGNAISQAPPS